MCSVSKIVARFAVVAFSVGLSCGGTKAAETSTNRAQSVDVLVLATTTGLQAVASLSAVFLKDQLTLRVVADSAYNTKQNQKALQELAHARQDKISLAVIVLADTQLKPGVTNSYISLGHKYGIIDFGVLKAGLGSQDLPARMLEVHATRACMRVIGFLEGLKDCPNPFCAMNNEAVRKRQPLGRNYCPPCSAIVRERLEKQGLCRDSTVPHRRKSP